MAREQQLGKGGFQNRMQAIGDEFTQRNQDKLALGDARMRNEQGRRFANRVGPEQQIQIAGTSGQRFRAATAQISFDTQ